VNHLFALKNHNRGCFGGYALLTLWVVCFCLNNGALAQSKAAPVNTSAVFSTRATHLLGLPKTKRNCSGTLSIQDSALQFQANGKPGVQIGMASILRFSLGDESKQVGGLPMTLGKAAAPFGGGRVVSLVAHKKYDTLTFEYVEGNGGIHGAIFQLKKGEGELVRNELVTRGASSSPGEDQPVKRNALEVKHEDK